MSIVISAMPKWRFDASQVIVPEDWDIRFINPSTEKELILACKEADYLLVPASTPEINANVLRNITHIKLIQSVGAGFDRIDTQTAATLKIPVANVPGQNAKSVAEFTIGLMIALQRQILVADWEIKAGRYGEIRKILFKQGLNEIEDSKIGLVGLGSIGQHVARILHSLGASVSYYDGRRQLPETEAQLQVSYKSLAALLADSDIVSLHVPLNDTTRGLIGQRQLELMSPGSFLINTARGEIVNQTALAQMLETGRIGGAAIDVFTPEPPKSENPLLNLSPAARARLIVTPHIAGVTVGAMRKMLQASLENIARVINGQPPANIVNR
ncbi:Hydroxypyruvate reductase [Sporomusa silvacetica DSM 10669]|uniref:Hydroxypyruvate reductase n=1 Tax=Sporomusa silvacetica DSM 10669 TaxID=1123289 RepID=A0ABZ3IUP5_9FIRM|nr:2-hydroxyacid dehydrogenase [Sporomusa silvacetica]OZC12990.1 hydroxypyruvate reductase [Sporomusa silvacetica DSM 10669]